MSKPLKFAYFGTPEVARKTLEALLEAGHTPSVAVTNPDAPKGRGMQFAPSPVKTLALATGIPVLAPEKIDDAVIGKIRGFECDYAVVIAYGKLFPQALIDAFPRGMVNVHYSLLPKYRGASPVEAALLNADAKTGVTLQKLALMMDAGDILSQKELAVGPGETARELFPRLIALGASILIEALPAFERGELTPAAQDNSRATYCKKIPKEAGLLDLSADARENWNKYRAYILRPGTYFMKGGVRMKITKASFSNGRFLIERVIPEGKREIEYSDAG